LPDTARALSDLVQTDERPFKKLKKSDPLLREQVQHPGSCSKMHKGRLHSPQASCLAHFKIAALQASQLNWPIRKEKHLSSRIMVARAKAALSMRDQSSAADALESFLQQLQYWAREHPDKFSSIASSVALLAVAHLAVKALEWAGPQNPLVPSIMQC